MTTHKMCQQYDTIKYCRVTITLYMSAEVIINITHLPLSLKFHTSEEASQFTQSFSQTVQLPSMWGCLEETAVHKPVEE